jgi:hypothetical protein
MEEGALSNDKKKCGMVYIQNSAYTFYCTCASREEGRGQSIHLRLLIYTPGCVQRHSLKFNILLPVANTDKKENQIFLKYKEIQKGEVASHI